MSTPTVPNHKNIEITFARAELRREVLKLRSYLKSQEDDSETETVSIQQGDVHYQSLPSLESDLKHFTTEAHQLAATCGILVGKLNETSSSLCC